MKLKCPICKEPTDSETTEEFPFCSKRCREHDLGNWATGKYKETELSSGPFEVGDQILAKQSIPAVFEFFKHQRANSPEEYVAKMNALSSS